MLLPSWHPVFAQLALKICCMPVLNVGNAEGQSFAPADGTGAAENDLCVHDSSTTTKQNAIIRTIFILKIGWFCCLNIKSACLYDQVGHFFFAKQDIDRFHILLKVGKL